MTRSVAALFLIGSFAWAPPFANAEPTEELVIADFDSGNKPNNLGGDFGAWDKDPDDLTQGAKMRFTTEDALGDPAGYSIRITYDVDSPNPAYNGLWMKLGGMDARAYSQIHFYVKGDVETGFSQRIKIELKDSTRRSSPYLLRGVTGEWTRLSVPFNKFPKIEKWSSLDELIIVFDDVNTAPKEGSLFIDHITFS